MTAALRGLWQLLLLWWWLLLLTQTSKKLGWRVLPEHQVQELERLTRRQLLFGQPQSALQLPAEQPPCTSWCSAADSASWPQQPFEWGQLPRQRRRQQRRPLG